MDYIHKRNDVTFDDSKERTPRCQIFFYSYIETRTLCWTHTTRYVISPFQPQLLPLSSLRFFYLFSIPFISFLSLSPISLCHHHCLPAHHPHLFSFLFCIFSLLIHYISLTHYPSGVPIWPPFSSPSPFFSSSLQICSSK